ncbi:hypothetical protein RRG08_055282 [Elysia crispata]|uniref:Uncharacterized protein n=1 Tax=Elysia crispata TaxID=231223 RepID=A0AAE1DQF4_9GAST|nr:hypothetical protein RRG08_055282 [Elysia crispata]
MVLLVALLAGVAVLVTGTALPGGMDGHDRGMRQSFPRETELVAREEDLPGQWRGFVGVQIPPGFEYPSSR